MKHLILYIFLFIHTNLPSQNTGIQFLENLNASKIIEQLELKNIDIVILGEARHLESEVIHLNQQIITILHQKYGFEVLILESDVWSLLQYSKCDTCQVNLKNNIHKVWSNTVEFSPLLQYIDSSNLKVYGFDSRLHGAYSKSNIPAFLKRNFPANLCSESEKISFLNFTENLLKNEFKDTTNLDKFQKHISLLDSWLNSISDKKSSFYFELSTIKNFFNQILVEKDSESKYIEIREDYMVSNIEYLLENELKGKKVILMGANIHVQPGITKLSNHASKNVGDLVKSKNNINSLSISYITNTRKPSRESLEYQLHKEKSKYALIDLRKINSNSMVFTTGESSPNIYGDYLLYIKKTKPAKMVD